ncbi:MAG: hypothetical protein PHE93_02820 [Clostridia bacterium]|nr:hypothetical protein [Clostridia bacterium]
MANSKTAVVKCKNCGADLVWDATKGRLACPYCDGETEIEKKSSALRDYYTCSKDGYVEEGGTVYHCPNCDAETTIEGFDTAVNCPFCGATNIMKTENLPGLKPDSILPFKLTADDACLWGRKWIKKRIFAPSKCKKNFNPDKFKGVYIPNFSFNTDTDSNYDGVLGEYYYVTVGTGKNRHTVRRTRWFNVSGSLDKDYTNLLVEASSHIEQKQLGKILPFDLAATEAYRPEYLAGFSAERYNTSLQDSFGIAKGIIDADIRKAILNLYNADVVQTLNVSTSFKTINFKYILLPIWICGYSFKQKLYQFIVNARTGKSTGKAPVSPLRVLIAVLLGLGIAALAIWGLGIVGNLDSGILSFSNFQLLN